MPATTAGNTNVLLHITGFFKPEMADQDRDELIETVDRYQSGEVMLDAPLALIHRHLRCFPNDYLERQYYLFPWKRAVKAEVQA